MMDFFSELDEIQSITAVLFFAAMFFACVSGTWIRKKITIGVLEASLLPIVAAVIVLLLPFPFFEVPYLVSVMGLVLFLKGVIIQELAVMSLGNNIDDFWFSKNAKKERFVVESGLYKYVRHPIYTGMILMYVGLLCVFFNYVTLLGVLVALLIIVITAINEEKFLIKKFPDYILYKKKTGMFLPRIW